MFWREFQLLCLLERLNLSIWLGSTLSAIPIYAMHLHGCLNQFVMVLTKLLDLLFGLLRWIIVASLFAKLGLYYSVVGEMMFLELILRDHA
jgi:hypothetical protein